MYLPAHFESPSTEAVHRLIADHPLGALVVHGPNGLDANHLPFLLMPDEGPHGHLIAHVARANPVWREMANGGEALVIFRGSHAYVSPNWYPSKHEQHRQVPTWNYLVVHAHGTLRIRDDERFVRGVVARLTRVHEAGSGAERPWKMTDSSPDYIDEMLGKIVGIDIEIARIVGKWKLSQNKEDRDRISAAGELGRRGELEISEAMLNALPPRKT